ncbi:hypothetical protein L3081_08725 [Colwellia sp. MSW7]|jgi:hypothetical protein|uniref:Uncharacterized protein n=1 Tax=Colwellia maritima TaxID=2912588 RepID=A0ABS9WZP5_9GAMM|nr:hypothetical protein [Colwellia maritima]MCI2283469.1 hypothetical protein [Colwellia maritima]
MYSLNIRDLHSVAIKSSLCLLFCTFLFACSSTKQVNTKSFSENSYFHTYGFTNDKLDDVQLNAVNEEVFQKTPRTDHQLMMALLNRPVSPDQAMMLAFEQERVNYSHYSSYYGVSVKGDKGTDEINYRTSNAYSNLIAQDINAVIITAPN